MLLQVLAAWLGVGWGHVAHLGQSHLSISLALMFAVLPAVSASSLLPAFSGYLLSINPCVYLLLHPLVHPHPHFLQGRRVRAPSPIPLLLSRPAIMYRVLVIRPQRFGVSLLRFPVPSPPSFEPSCCPVCYKLRVHKNRQSQPPGMMHST